MDTQPTNDTLPNNVLFLIPARGGSKGILHKNRKLLGGKPLICYAIDAARGVISAARGATSADEDICVSTDEDICVSTDDPEIMAVVEGYGLKVPFIRPEELAGDHSGTYEVILHALDFYEKQGKKYDTVVLLQPTSPFRTAEHVREAMALYSPECDMVVSVSEMKSNPYYVMFREEADGYLHPLLQEKFTRRQDCPVVYEYNGAVYVMNVSALREKHLSAFTKNRKYIMPASVSIDLDTPEDWKYAEFLLRERP